MDLDDEIELMGKTHARLTPAEREAADFRCRNERTISSLYGCPGTDYDTEEGRAMLLDVIERIGFEALTDRAIAGLAAANLWKDRSLGS